MPEPQSDNDSAKLDSNGELHPGEVLEEKLSLAERFGLWLSFYPFSQKEYLEVIAGALEHLGVSKEIASSEAVRLEAIQFAIQRGGRSGRVALQFSKDIAGRVSLGKFGA